MKPKKYSYYDENGKWFSSSNGLDIDSHKKRFGDDITFSVIGLEGRFSTEAEYRDAIKNNKTTFDSRTKEEKDQDINNAKDRVKEKRSIRKHIESFNDFKK